MDKVIYFNYSKRKKIEQELTDGLKELDKKDKIKNLFNELNIVFFN